MIEKQKLELLNIQNKYYRILKEQKSHDELIDVGLIALGGITVYRAILIIDKLLGSNN